MDSSHHDSLIVDGLLVLAARRLGDVYQLQLEGNLLAAFEQLSMAEEYLRKARRYCEEHLGRTA